MRAPHASEVVVAAQRLGIEMQIEEAAMYASAIGRHLIRFEAFYGAHIPEEQYDRAIASRDRGYRPSVQEDPYNAWTWKCRIDGLAGGVLEGKRIGLKDHIPVATLPLTYGSYLMQDFIADFDAPIVTRLLNAGATIVGKCNMDPFSCAGGGFGAVSDFGRVLNPQHPDHITGGSSSGCAAAVAAGDCDIAIGGDQGGSVRIPAAWCGVVGLMPTAGLVPHTAVLGSDPSLDRIGPMAMSVSEVATTLKVLAGSDGYDYRQLRTPRTYSVADEFGPDLDDIRIGVLEEAIAEPIEPDVLEAFGSAVEGLRALGAQIANVSVPLHRAAITPYLVLSAEGARQSYDTRFIQGSSGLYPRRLITELDKSIRSDPSNAPAVLKLRYLLADFSRQAFRGGLYAKAQNARQEFVAAYDDAFRRVDVLIMPTVTFRAPRYEPLSGWTDGVERALGVQAFGPYVTNQNTAPFNYTGHPAISIPCGTSAGLPVGLQIVGKFFDEGTILRVAAAFERRRSPAIDTKSFGAVSE